MLNQFWRGQRQSLRRKKTFNPSNHCVADRFVSPFIDQGKRTLSRGQMDFGTDLD
jgi:hypothetical protein